MSIQPREAGSNDDALVKADLEAALRRQTRILARAFFLQGILIIVAVWLLG